MAMFATVPVVGFNLCRRHVDPIRWGQAFMRLLEERGIELRPGPKCKVDNGNTATVAEIASEVGVSQSTAEKRVAQAKQYLALPAKQRKTVDNNGS